MALSAFHVLYGRRTADRVAERDRIEARERAGNSAAAGGLSASFGATADSDVVTTSYEWELVERGVIDAAMAMRLIKGREAGERAQQQQKTAEKLGPD